MFLFTCWAIFRSSLGKENTFSGSLVFARAGKTMQSQPSEGFSGSFSGESLCFLWPVSEEAPAGKLEAEGELA